MQKKRTPYHSGEVLRKKDKPSKEWPSLPGYPGELEKLQQEIEESLVHFLSGERFQEALMAVQNLDNRSRDYQDQVIKILEGPEVSREFHERTLHHVKRSLQIQESVLFYLKQRLKIPSEVPKKRERLSKMISALILCRHRNTLIRRRVMVSQGSGMSLGKNKDSR